MNTFNGEALSWDLTDGIVELALHHPPANEIGTLMLAELEKFAAALPQLEKQASALIIYSRLSAGFSAGADLRALYQSIQTVSITERVAGARDFLARIHRALNTIDSSELTTIAAVHGVTFGGGFELALVCDLIIADKMTRFCFPELRLGLIPSFGGIPRLKRDLGNAVVRDLLLTGRSLNAQRLQNAGLVSQLTAEGKVLDAARFTAKQVSKFDRRTAIEAKRFIKPIPYEELKREIEIFCDLFTRPEVEEGLRKFVENTTALPYLP
jgi:enoyl-CoA hydratase